MNLPAVIQAYPYLFSGLLGLGAVLLIAARLPLSDHRRLILRLGLLMTVNFPFAVFSEADYWAPARMGGWKLGIEDALCAFDIGALAPLPAVLVWRSRLLLAERPVPRIGRLISLAAATHGCFGLLLLLGWPSMTSLIVMQLVPVVPLLLWRRNLWQFAAAGGIGSLMLHCGIVKVCFWIWPAFASCWRSAPPWGQLWFGIPLGEMVWAASFGLFWSLLAGFVFDLRLVATARTPDACAATSGP